MPGRKSLQNHVTNPGFELAGPQRRAAYSSFYSALSRLREEFHRTGRFDDANAKLDEMVKLIVMRFHEAQRARRGLVDRFNEEYLASFARERFGDPNRIALALRTLSEQILSDPAYRNPDGTSIFGNHSSLNIQASEDEFAKLMLKEVCLLTAEIDVIDESAVGTFDLLNESFGHFVRDTFHNTKEDAQYMTPPEVVESMIEMAFADIERDEEMVGRILGEAPGGPFIVLDPTCGVGSFLVQALRAMVALARRRGISGAPLESLAAYLRDHCIYGQDKVDRMVRLARVNMMLFGGGGTSIWQGNSIVGPSRLDALAGTVDLILTNPPFGAEFNAEELLSVASRDQYAILHELRHSGRLPRTLNSEVLLLDRCLSLLRPGGRLLIVLPDKVVSARGVEATVRERVRVHAELLAVVELPAVTFAQAGTRTKTCIVYLRKRPAGRNTAAPAKTYMAVCASIGYQVVERTGAPVKVAAGENELRTIVGLYRDTAQTVTPANELYTIVGEKPSVVWVRFDALLNGRWTPNFYHVKRLKALSGLQALREAGFEIRPLVDVARLCSKERRTEPPLPNRRVISVLHVSTDGVIDLKAVAEYNPKTQALNCRAGEILFSKINPQIPRVCVVPKASFALGCSTEFEILQPLKGINPYLLAYLLMAPVVQEQVRCLTSGTSSSHNRIKDTELAQVLIPLPAEASLVARFSELASVLQRAVEDRYRIDTELSATLTQLYSLLRTSDEVCS